MSAPGLPEKRYRVGLPRGDEIVSGDGQGSASIGEARAELRTLPDDCVIYELVPLGRHPAEGGAWLAKAGAALAQEVDRLWPNEDSPAYRGACLAEEAGEVNRAITKRRHAINAPSGLCKGKTPAEWTNELRIELAQALGVILDIAHREGFNLFDDVNECVGVLQNREVGT